MQYSKLGYRIDLYFHYYKLAIEIDENGHSDRNIEYEIKKQQNNNLVVNLLELIIPKKTLIFLKLLMKYLDTSNNCLVN